MLDYFNIVVLNTKNETADFENTRKRHMCETSKKMRKTFSGGLRDTSFWKAAPFSSIRAETFKSCLVLLPFVDRVDRLFENECGCKTFPVFCKFEVSISKKLSYLSVVSLEVLTTVTTDGFKNKLNGLDFEFGGESAKFSASSRVLRKSGSMLLNSLQCMKSLVPRATNRFLWWTLRVFLHAVQ